MFVEVYRTSGSISDSAGTSLSENDYQDLKWPKEERNKK